MKIKHIILYSAVLLLSCANSIYKGPHVDPVLAENKIIAYRWFWDILKEDYFMRYESPKHRSRLKKENGYGEVCIQSKTR